MFGRVLALSLLVSTNANADNRAIAVLDIQGTGIDASLLPTLTEILTVEIDALGAFKVIAGRDIQSMLGFEKQKDVLGCTDAACLAEIGGALGVDRIVASHIGKVGSTYVVNIKLINIRLADTEGRVYETVRGEVDALIDTVRKSVGKLLGKEVAELKKPKPTPKVAAAAAAAKASPAATTSTPAPEVAVAPAATPTVEKESSGGGPGVPSIALWIGGVAVVGAGIAFGVVASGQEEEANDPSAVGGQKAAESAPTSALLANVFYGVGGAAIAAGLLVWLLSGDDDAATALAPMIGPDTIGVAFSGGFF